MKLVYNLESTILAKLDKMTLAQRDEAIRKGEKAIARREKRRQALTAIRDELNRPETERERDAREAAEAMAAYDRDFPEISFLDEQPIPIVIAGGRVRNPLPAHFAKIAAENRERERFWKARQIGKPVG